LLAHITHIEDNARFAQQTIPLNSSVQFTSQNRTYFDWVRTTSADHTSCPYSFIFFSCLVSLPGKDLFQCIKEKYLAADVCRHLASMCRQYNDYGSLARDRVEKNLNSINFSEFGAPLPFNQINGYKDLVDIELDTKLKEKLFWIAEYERECLSLAIQKLGEQIDQNTMDVIKVFINVTDLYGQIYMIKDIATRMK
jgi:hypothetical protein